MTRIIVDDVLREKLQNFARPLEICDENGRVFGRLFPVPDLSQYEPVGPQVSEEEIQRRMRSNEKRYTTAEVLAYLEKLG